ncbi:uncharacterized protein LOC141649871 [Silene latifolia]|uniref:uncharacterized protein LOC141649871 n=1 Tax=Silene latifolia TaxID=37657 RepID=UPI003D772DEA
MGAFKAPGPDGIPACFYQKCWSLIKGEFTKAVLSILKSGRVLREANRTFITLILKTDTPEGVSDYRPISLCNVIMRVVTKCIANRMAKVMGSLISESQNAFLPGRGISDNILVAHEAIHNISRFQMGKHGRCAFKADMSKAYDRDKGRTAENLMCLINEYCTASGQKINPTKSGIIFSPNTTLAKAQNILKVFRIRANKGIGKYLGIPAEFQESKKGIFNALVEHTTKRISSWNEILLSPAGRLTLISSVLSNLSNYFLSVFKIPVSVSKKINSLLAQFWWTGCKLGKNIHWCSKNFPSFPKCARGLGIRNVACLNQALLAKHGWRLVSGDTSLFSKIFRHKLFGTNTFSHSSVHNKGTGASWGVPSTLHGFHLIREHIGWKPGRNSSLNVWLSRWVGGVCPEPRDCWLGVNDVQLANLQVRHLLLPNDGWNEPYIRTLFKEDYTEKILAIPFRNLREVDEVFWPYTRDGVYTVMSGYGLIFDEYMCRHGSQKDKARMGDRGKVFCRKQLWHLPIPNIWKILIWRILPNTLPVGMEFKKRDLDMSVTCGMCGTNQGQLETVEHIFRDCAIAGRIWAGSDLGIRVENAGSLSIIDWIIDWVSYLAGGEEGKKRVIMFMAVMWGMWNLRNRVKFDGMTLNSQVISGFLFTLIKEKANILIDHVDGARLRTNPRGVDDVVLDTMQSAIKDGFPFQMIGNPDQCDIIRVKVEASWNRNYAEAFRWVAYDWTGRELKRRQVRSRAESALQAEAMRVRDVLIWASLGGHLHLQISTDCLQLIYELAGVDKADHLIVALLEDMRSLSSVFHCLSFTFIPRYLNILAHGLTQQAMRL